MNQINIFAEVSGELNIFAEVSGDYVSWACCLLEMFCLMEKASLQKFCSNPG